MRSACVNVAVTSRDMQQFGILFLLEPGLRHLYAEPAARAAAAARYAGYSSIHPFFVPLYAGVMLSLEEAVAKKAVPETMLCAVRATLATTLSALGDSCCGGALLPFWALACTLCLVHGAVPLAWVLTGVFFAAQVLFRLASFFCGLRQGMAALVWLRRWRMANWAGVLKCVNAVLTALLLWHGVWLQLSQDAWAGGIGLVLLIPAGAWMVQRWHLPRLLLWCLILAVWLMDAAVTTV